MSIAKTTVGPATTTGWSSWELFRGDFNFSIFSSSTHAWTGTVTIQRLFSTAGTSTGGSTAMIYGRYTGSTQGRYLEPEDGVYYRIGITTTATNKVGARLSK